MYIETIDTSEDNRKLSNNREGIRSSFVKLVDYGFRGKTVNNDKTRLENMIKLDHQPVVGMISRNEEKSCSAASYDFDEFSRFNKAGMNENCDEKCIDGNIIVSMNKTIEGASNDGEEEFDKNVETLLEENEKNHQNDDFECDNDEELASLFDDKLKSIFIRKNTLLDDNDELSTEGIKKGINNCDKRIVKESKKDPKKLEKNRAISFVDILLSLFIVGPLVIGQWRGIWTMMDIYSKFFPEWLCFIIGTCLHILFAIGRDVFHGQFAEKLRRNHGAAGRVTYDIVRLLYIYIFCVACNAHWRGGWKIFSHYCGTNIWVSNLFTTIFASGLIILRSFRNLLAPPFIVVIDRPERVFRFPTRYNVNTRDWSLYILDCAFSVGVVGSLVVFVWRGVWVLFDFHLFPENQEYSAIGSLVIGYIIVTVTFCLQPLMRYTCARLQGLARLLAADAFLLLSFLGTVNVWRGIWNVLDLWLLPDDIELSCWITHVGCFVFLVLLNCSNSILVRGVYIDAEEEEGRCVVFPCHYLRLFFKIERQKKEARRQNLVAASKEVQSRTEGNAKEVENETLLNCTNTIPIIISANPESLV